MRHGLHGPLNWYRTRRINFEDDLEWVDPRRSKQSYANPSRLGTKQVMQPVLFISGRLDAVLKPEMSKGMEMFVANLRRREVEAGHWALTQVPREVNETLGKWLDEVVFRAKSVL